MKKSNESIPIESIKKYKEENKPKMAILGYFESEMYWVFDNITVGAPVCSTADLYAAYIFSGSCPPRLIC